MSFNTYVTLKNTIKAKIVFLKHTNISDDDVSTCYTLQKVIRDLNKYAKRRKYLIENTTISLIMTGQHVIVFKKSMILSLFDTFSKCKDIEPKEHPQMKGPQELVW